MFELQTNFKQILKLFNPRTQPIQSTVTFLQDPYYLEFLGQCSDTEITPDIDLFGYETTDKGKPVFRRACGKFIPTTMENWSYRSR